MRQEMNTDSAQEYSVLICWQVELSYDNSRCQPGETVSLTIKADPNSTVYILAEDERSRVFGTENDIYYTEVVLLL